MKKIILVGSLLTFSACAMPQQWGARTPGAMKKTSPQEAPQQEPQQFVDESIEVVTDPPGARILVNGSSAGYAPVTVKVRRLWRGGSGSPMMLDTVRLEAIPVVEDGQCAQISILGAGAAKTPAQVRFDMRLCGGTPAQPQPVNPGSK
jgi:hypothetical protein